MKKGFVIPLLIIFALAVLMLKTPNFVFGENDDEYYDPGIATEINSEVKEINSGIQDKKGDIKKLQQKQKKYSQAIKEKQMEKASLGNQMAILDNRMAKSELDIEMVKIDIERTELEMRKTDIAIEAENFNIAEEKSHMGNVIRLIYKKDNVSSLEVMLLNDSFAEFLSQVKNLEDINDSLADSLKYLQKMKRGLESDLAKLDEQKIDLIGLKEELVEKDVALSEEKETKVHILSQVLNSENEYQRLLKLAKKEQEEAAAEIASMEKLVRAKIAKMAGNKLEFNDEGLIWPVTKNVITAYFHDPDYPFRHIFEHPAVDIRAAQGAQLRAAASGYVARTKHGKDGSYGYIMIIHGDNLSTVYGHASKITVQEDDYVVQGQVIGATGGLPGTRGAGRLTTGPHLHFEVRLNGIPVDPLSYLP